MKGWIDRIGLFDRLAGFVEQRAIEEPTLGTSKWPSSR